FQAYWRDLAKMNKNISPGEGECRLATELQVPGSAYEF
ncbi:hypothetical protein A2U01_0113312, partial [Trifolium medium]|nr:hypothetical protein [Trifolium medium]